MIMISFLIHSNYKNYVWDNQVYGLITETEEINMFIKEQCCVIKKNIAHIINQSEQQSNKEVVDFLQE